MVAAMRCRLTVLVVSWLATAIQAYRPGNAPIQWMHSQANVHTKPPVLAPKDFAGHVRGFVAPQELMLRDQPDNVSPKTIPYFTVESDESIVWGDRGWCIGADQNGENVHVGYCTGAPTQKWSWIPDGLGRHRIQLKNTNLCVVASSQGGLNGTPVVLRDCHTQMTETWKLEEPVAFPSQSMTLNQALPSHFGHVSISLFVLAGVGVLCLGAWSWQTRTKQKTLAAVSQRSVPVGAEQDVGVSMMVPLAISEKLHVDKRWNCLESVHVRRGHVSMSTGTATPSAGMPHGGDLVSTYPAGTTTRENLITECAAKIELSHRQQRKAALRHGRRLSRTLVCMVEQANGFGREKLESTGSAESSGVQTKAVTPPELLDHDAIASGRIPIVVEGKWDIVAVRRVFKDAQLFETRGCPRSGVRIKEVVLHCKRLLEKWGAIVVLTDPERPGRTFRNQIGRGLGHENVWHAFVTPARATSRKRARSHAKGNVGVEHADPAAIQEALLPANLRTFDPERCVITAENMFALGLAALHGTSYGGGVKARRHYVSQMLGFGECDGKQILKMLNGYHFTLEDVKDIVANMPPHLGSPTSRS